MDAPTGRPSKGSHEATRETIATDLISAGAIATLPLVDALTGLSVGWFVLFAVIGSLGDVPGLTAREALLPAITRAGRVSAERLIGLREGLGAIGLLAGPAIAGTLRALALRDVESRPGPRAMRSPVLERDPPRDRTDAPTRRLRLDQLGAA